MTDVVRYPTGPITPHGWYFLTKGQEPMMRLTAHDGSVEFYLMGGHSIPKRIEAPECLRVPKEGLKGLIPPWKHIDQKGATEDGVTHLDALLEPTEVELTVWARGRDGKYTRQIVRHLYGSIDAIKEAKLDFLTPDGGHWWANVRWFQGAPKDPIIGAQEKRQRVTLRLRADTGCWRTYDHSDSFNFVYDSMVENFDTDHRSTQDLGDVPQYYFGPGGGYCTSDGRQMVWVDDPEDTFTTERREVVNGPWPDFDTDTNNQVIVQQHSGFQEWSVPESARNTIWGRMGFNEDGTWDGSGVRLYYGIGWVRLSYFIDFEEVAVLREQPLIFPPLPTEKFTLVCGYAGDERKFRVLRNGLPIMSVKENGTGSPLGPSNRGVGNGMHAASALITQATPAPIGKLSAGDNANMTQSGWLERVNIGDQKMYDDYTLFGPGTFKIYDGPGSDEYVEFGPLLPNQIVFLRTDPRVNTTLVQDMTVVPPTPQELDIFQDALSKFLSFAGMNESAFGDQIKSMFGIRPPQGNLYKYLKGRFSERAAIPPMSPGRGAQPYYVKVEIVGGNADSMIVASGVPLRRYPL
ncbi:minor tail protein [Mycobacterium phage Renaud18]|uniref:Minor tail protein n=1 Tax=Mycobacterium phage Renaud18 TaxID=2301701 RepID=A0A385E1Y3_9CAUD|nr:minor tail protein [Mycobacterium phage Renaud18]AXQ64927.1 minor tail protein [Mycobacterium phage Renaud18]